MARLIRFVVFGLISSLSNPVQAAQIGSNIERADLNVDCPTCNNEPPHPGPRPWGDWNMTSSSTNTAPVVLSSSSVPSYGSLSSSSVASIEMSVGGPSPSTITSQTSAIFVSGTPVSDSLSLVATLSGSSGAGIASPVSISSSISGVSSMQSFSNTNSSIPSHPLSSSSTNAMSTSQMTPALPPGNMPSSQGSVSVVSRSSESGSQATESITSASNLSQPIEPSSMIPPFSNGTSSRIPPFPVNSTSSMVPFFSRNSSASESTMSPHSPPTDRSSASVSSPSVALTLNVTAGSEITSSFTSTIDLSSTTFITVIRTTISIVQVSSTTQAASSSVPPPVPSSPSSSSSRVGSEFSTSASGSGSSSGGNVSPQAPSGSRPSSSSGTHSTSVSESSSSSTVSSSPSVLGSGSSSGTSGPLSAPGISSSSSGTIIPLPGITMTSPMVTPPPALPTVSLNGEMPCSYSYTANDTVPREYGLAPWCWPWPFSGEESTTMISGTVVAASTLNCLCPLCWLASPLCYDQKPSGSSCADGWICSVTTSAGQSGIVHSLPSGFSYDTSTPDPWSMTTEQGVTRTSGTSSTTSMSWTATLSHSTRSIQGGYIDFPFWSWSCIGPLCKPDCGDILDWVVSMATCILGLGCHRPCSNHGWNGFPLPPIPVLPPIPPVSLATLTVPTTHCSALPCTNNPSANPSPEPTTNSPSSSGTSSSSSSCSSTAFSSCIDICSTLNSNGTVSATQSCTRSCTTVTQCSGNNTFTTSTVNASTTIPACTASPWWNDPSISAEIASWITQFPPIPDNATVQFSTFSFASNTTQTMGNTTSSTLTSTAHSTTLTSQSSTISSPPITTPVIPSSLRDFTVLATDSNGNVYSEVYSGGVMISSTLVSSNSFPTLPASGPWTFASSGVSLVSRTTSTLPISVGSGAHPTLTSMTRSYSEVSIFTCDGVAAFGSASCTNSWGLKTVSTTVPNADEQTSYCAHWTAFTTTTNPAKAGVLNCATPVSGKATSSVATAWNSGLPFSPFQLDIGPIMKFCKSLVDREIVLYEGLAFGAAASAGLVSPGECDLFPSNGDSKFNYDLTLALAFDYNGCPSPTGSPLVNGVSMKSYGEDKCVSSFSEKLVDKCEFSNSDAKNRGLGQWTKVGGIYWGDCMRWTVIAARNDLSPPDTVDGNLQ